MKLKALMAASAAAMVIGGSASASMVYNIISEPAPVAGNDFFSDYESMFGVGNVGFGIVQSAELLGYGKVQVDFSFYDEESGFDNQYVFAVTPPDIGAVIGEDQTGTDTTTLTAPATFSGTDMQFSDLDGKATPAALGDTGFGIFYDLTATSDHSSTVFLAYSDRGSLVDGDYDDIVIKTTGAINVVPLPAAGWMLLAGLGGMAALRRRQKS